MAKSFVLNRRAILAGAAGAALSLPALEAMMPTKAFAGPGDMPKRFVFVYCGIPPVGEELNKTTGKPPQFVIPDAAGPLQAAFKVGLEPLETQGLRQDTTVISSLRIPTTGSGNGRRYGSGGFHYETAGPIVSGVSDLTNQFSRYSLGPSCDWLLSEQIGAQTRLPSLVYMVQSAAFSDYTLDYISYKPRTGNFNPQEEPATVRVDPVVSPRAAFDQLFNGFVPPPTTGGPPPPPDPETLRRRDILQRVQASYKRLQPKLGGADRHRLDQHIDNIHTLEQRVNALLLPSAGGIGCKLPGAPGADPPVAGGYANEDARAAAFVDLVYMAFACDLSRVVSLEMTSSMSGIVLPTSLGITYRDYDNSALAPPPLHEATHGQGNNLSVAECIRWHMKHVAALAKRLKDTPEFGGTMLDNTAIVFVMEAGLGSSSMQGGNIVGEVPPHTSEGMVAVVIGGRKLGIKLGQHIVSAGQHPASVILTGMRAVAPAITGLGEIKTEITGLRG